MFGEGIRKEDIIIQRDRQDLVLKIKENGEETKDSIRVDDYFYESIQDGEVKYCGVIEKFQFSDGNVLELEEIKKAVQVISEGNDVYYDYGAGEKDKELHMGAGNDTVYANNGDDVVYGELGDDTLYGESGNDTLYGGEGNDFLDGGNGNNLLYGEAGNDTIYAGDGVDVIYGGEGNDYVSAGYGDDRLYGEAGNDSLDGGYGSDYIEGGEGNDTIYGGDGADTIIGGEGNDYLNGGYGSDIYLYNRGDGADRINDWDYNVNNVDTISFGANISKSDIVASREYQDLVLQIQQNGENTGDSIRIDYYYSEDTQNGNPVYRNAVEQFTFENGDTTTLSDILSLELTSGGEGVALYEEPTVLEQSALLVQNMASYDDSAMMTTNNFDTLTTENTEYVENIWVK